MTTDTLPPLPERLLKLAEVLDLYPVSRTTWLDGVRRGVYPRPVKIAARRVAWRESEIRRLIEQCQSEVGV